MVVSALAEPNAVRFNDPELPFRRPLPQQEEDASQHREQNDLALSLASNNDDPRVLLWRVRANIGKTQVQGHQYTPVHAGALRND